MAVHDTRSRLATRHVWQNCEYRASLGRVSCDLLCSLDGPRNTTHLAQDSFGLMPPVTWIGVSSHADTVLCIQ